MQHRGVTFQIDRVGLDLWRWAVPAPTPPGFQLIGQVRGDRDAAIAHCRRLIEARPAAEEAGGVLKTAD